MDSSEITIEDFDNWKQNKVTKYIMAVLAEKTEEYAEAILDGSISRGTSQEEFYRKYNYNLGVLDGLKFQMNIQFAEEQEEENNDGY